MSEVTKTAPLLEQLVNQVDALAAKAERVAEAAQQTEAYFLPPENKDTAPSVAAETPGDFLGRVQTIGQVLDGHLNRAMVALERVNEQLA